MLNKIAPHARRISYHLGRRVTIGRERFKIRGYAANPMSPESSDEPEIQVLLKRLLSQFSGTFIDVGVNTGQTLMKVIGIDRERKYIGFEPQIACCYFVDQFLRSNNLRNARVLPVALSDSNQAIKLYSSHPFDLMASIISGPNSSYVQARKGDDVLSELQVGDISVIKIDVEGAECSVLCGLKNTLRNQRPLVVFEVLPDNRGSAMNIYQIFQELNYEIFQLNLDGTETPNSQFDSAGFAGTNYVAYPK